MSESPPPEVPPTLSPGPPPQQRSGCLTAILIAIGIVMLLPGLCSLIFVFGGLVKNASDAWFVGMLMTTGAIGVAVIWWAIRRRGP
jgi:hypothetical protein